MAKVEKRTFMGPHLNNHRIANEIKPSRWQYFGASTDIKEKNQIELNMPITRVNQTGG